MFYVMNAPPSPFSPTPEGRQSFIEQALFAINRLRASVEQTEFKNAPVACDDALNLPTFVADIAAISRLAHWEKSGEKQYLDQTLPLYQAAIGDLEARVASDPDAFFGREPATTPLYELVADAGNKGFQFSTELSAMVLVSEPDEAALIEAVAQLLWRHVKTPTKKEPK